MERPTTASLPQEASYQQRGSPLASGDLGNEFFAKFSYLFHF